MMTVICIKCGQTMRCAKNEFPVKDKATKQFPSTVWFGDLFKCTKCNCHVALGFGGPIENPSEDLLAEAKTFAYD